MKLLQSILLCVNLILLSLAWQSVWDHPHASDVSKTPINQSTQSF